MYDSGSPSSSVAAESVELQGWLHDIGAMESDVYEFFEIVARPISAPEEWVNSFSRPLARHKWAFVVPNADLDPAPAGIAMPVLSREVAPAARQSCAATTRSAH